MVESLSAALPWLLDPANPSARYLTLRYLLDRPPDDADVAVARAAILDSEPAASIVKAQWPGGYWVAPNRGYAPRYRATLWQLFFLAQLGAPCDERIARAWAFAWDNGRRADGLFTPHQAPQLDDLVILNGSLLWALRRYDQAGDPRVGQVLDAVEALDLRPLLRAARVNAVTRLCLGLGAWDDRLAPRLSTFRAAAVGWLGERLQAAGNGQWPFCFPLADRADLPEMLAVLPPAGQTANVPAHWALRQVRSKQLAEGRWALDTLPGKMWADFGTPGQANKWVTIRVLRVLRRHSQPG
jgi:hypothetical protein